MLNLSSASQPLIPSVLAMTTCLSVTIASKWTFKVECRIQMQIMSKHNTNRPDRYRYVREAVLIEQCKKGCLLTDAAAAAALCNRGFGDFIGKLSNSFIMETHWYGSIGHKQWNTFSLLLFKCNKRLWFNLHPSDAPNCFCYVCLMDQNVKLIAK